MNEMEYAVVDHKGEIVYHDETAIGAFSWAEVNLADDRYTVELMDKPSEPKMTDDEVAGMFVDAARDLSKRRRLTPERSGLDTPELFESKHCSPRPLSDQKIFVDLAIHNALKGGNLNLSVGQKHDQSKPRYSLIPSGSLASIVDVLEHGAAKYAPDNWKHVQGARERYYNASMRHVQAWWSGEQIDSESGLPHLAHAICSLMFLMTLDGEQGE